MKRLGPAAGNMRPAVFLVVAACLLGGCRVSHRQPATVPGIEGEGHLRNVRPLTSEGENAEAYFSADGRELVFQSTHGDMKCDQIFVMDID